MKKEPSEEEIEKMRRHVQTIHTLATRLPWIVVGSVFVTALFYIVLAFFAR